MPLTYDRWNIYYAALYDLITAQTGPGGMLDGIKQVRQIALPERNEFPYVGIEFDYDERKPAGTHEYEINTYFVITVGVSQPVDPKLVGYDVGELALQQLWPYLNDMHGNGMSTLLEQNPNLAGSTRSYIAGLAMKLADKKGSPASGVVAWAVYRYAFLDVLRPF